jgi:hypothetical protein
LILCLPAPCRPQPQERHMRGILLWLIGVPIPVILLIYLLF